MNIKKIIKESLLKESYSGVEGYLRALRDVSSGNGRIYYQWILDNLVRVPVVNHNESKVLIHHIKELLRTTPPNRICQKKGCYETAFNVALRTDLGISYVEGYVQSIIPIIHAWNYYPEENIYFDLTNDIAWKGEKAHFNEYYKVIELSEYELGNWANITGYAGGFMESRDFIKEIIESEGL